MRPIHLVIATAILVLLSACQSGPGSAGTTPVSTQGAQTIGGSQGTAQAAETGSATNYNISPTIIGAKSVKIGPDGSMEVEGSESATVAITGQIGGQTFGSDSMTAEVSSGGGAAGGTGGVSRATEGVGNRAGGNVGGAGQ